MNHELAVVAGFVGLDEVDDGGGLARARGAVQEKMGEVAHFEDVGQDGAVEGVHDNVVKMLGSVLFHPGTEFLRGRVVVVSFHKKRGVI